MSNKKISAYFAAFFIVLGVVTVHCDAAPEEAERLLAESYLASGQHEKAIEVYKEILSRDPGDMASRKSLADLLSWTGDLAEAVRQYETVLKTTEDMEVRISLGRVHMWRGDFDKAEAALDLPELKEADTPELRALRGRIFLWRGKFDKAAAELKTLSGEEERILRAKALLYSGRLDEAEQVLKRADEMNGQEPEAIVLLGDIMTQRGQYGPALELYRKALGSGEYPEAKERMADVLSWKRKYAESVQLYDEILAERYSPEVHRQKARVLGWMRSYDESYREYEKLFEKTGSVAVALEMEAKRYLYSGRVQKAASRYEELLTLEGDNAEALFDLAQIYSRSGLTSRAEELYERILLQYPLHSRAERALSKIRLISRRPLFSARYDLLRSKARGKETDLNVQILRGSLRVPLQHGVFMEVESQGVRHAFSDHPTAYGNRTLASVEYIKDLNWRASAYYGLGAYGRGISGPRHFFGSRLNYAPNDLVSFNFAHDREFLVNNSTVMKKGLYSDSFASRMELDLSRRLKLGADHRFSYFSDRNLLNEPAADISWLLSFEPQHLSMRYRYSYKHYRKEDRPYWTPRRFSTNRFTVLWRHYLNEEELFYGADELYYELRYDIELDSDRVVGHTVWAGISWDVDKRLNLELGGSATASSGGVYEENRFTGGVNYYF